MNVGKAKRRERVEKVAVVNRMMIAVTILLVFKDG